jgi:hypothetical protein
MMPSSREDSEKALGRALSRHIGYTSGAYHLNRIFSVLDQFKDRTSAYKQELVSSMIATSADERGRDEISEDYAGEILNFAVAIGLLDSVSGRHANLTRFAATETGRSILGVSTLGQPDFLRFYRAQIILRADADFLVPILLYYDNDRDDDLLSHFAMFIAELRHARLAWLIKNFPEPVLLERVVEHIGWIKRGRGPAGRFLPAELKPDTVRHHATPRQGWVEELGMIDRKKKNLTSFGKDILTFLAPASKYFWLAPPSDVLDSMGVTDRPEGLPEDRMKFSVSVSSPTEVEIARLCEDVRRVMLTGYTSAKLIHAAQASLQLPIEYIAYRSYRDRKNYDWERVIDTVFQANRESLQRYSAHKGKIGFYRVVSG